MITIKNLHKRFGKLTVLDGLDLDIGNGGIFAILGPNGSGKTTLLANLLKRKDMYKNAFDEVYLISPTARSDDIQKFLDLEDDHIVDDLKEAPGVLEDLMEDQRNKIETLGAHKAPLIGVVFDDVIGDRDLLTSPQFIKCFIAARHYNFTTMICSQSFKGVPRKCRLQANNIFFFRGSNSEMESVLEDRSPPGMNKKQGLSLIEFATKEEYSFLHINMRKPFEERYTRNLDETIHYTIQQDLAPKSTPKRSSREDEQTRSTPVDDVSEGDRLGTKRNKRQAGSKQRRDQILPKTGERQ